MTISLSCKKDNYVECKLCPNRCRLKEGEVGKCFVRKCDGDTIFLNNYGEFVSVAVNPIEKKPFINYLPGTKTLSIGGVGCSLSCAFCLPKDSLISTPSGPKRIDEIQDGEEIIALDNSNNDRQLVSTHVGHVSDRESEEAIVFEVDGGTLELTPEHPVMTKNRGWVEASNLTLDDEVLCDKTCLK